MLRTLKSRLTSLVLLLLIGLIHVDVSLSEHTELCRLFRDGTRLRKPGSCTEYIQCENGTGEVFSCVTPMMFDHNVQNCVETYKDDDYCENRCKNNEGKWISDPTNCHGYFYCLNDIPWQGYCPHGHHFDEKSQMCQYDTTSDCMIVNNICDIVPDKTRFRDEKDCSYYYECLKGQHKRQFCGSKGGYFDVTSAKCVNKQLVQCTAHPLPKDVCGTASRPKPGYKEDGATCRGYFYCADLGIVPDLEPRWGQCPIDTFFDPTSESCLPTINVPCKYNRCDGRGTRLVQSASNNCRNYVVCVDNVEVAEHSCSGDMFFDEKIQACTRNIIYYGCCDEQP